MEDKVRLVSGNPHRFNSERESRSKAKTGGNQFDEYDNLIRVFDPKTRTIREYSPVDDLNATLNSRNNSQDVPYSRSPVQQHQQYQQQHQQARSRSRSTSPINSGAYMTPNLHQKIRQSRALNLCSPLRINIIGRVNLISMNDLTQLSPVLIHRPRITRVPEACQGRADCNSTLATKRAPKTEHGFQHSYDNVSRARVMNEPPSDTYKSAGMKPTVLQKARQEPNKRKQYTPTDGIGTASYSTMNDSQSQSQRHSSATGRQSPTQSPTHSCCSSGRQSPVESFRESSPSMNRSPVQSSRHPAQSPRQSLMQTTIEEEQGSSGIPISQQVFGTTGPPSTGMQTSRTQARRSTNTSEMYTDTPSLPPSRKVSGSMQTASKAKDTTNMVSKHTLTFIPPARKFSGTSQTDARGHNADSQTSPQRRSGKKAEMSTQSSSVPEYDIETLIAAGIAQTGTMLVPRDDGGYDTVEVVHIMESPSGTPIVDNILRSGDLDGEEIVEIEYVREEDLSERRSASADRATRSPQSQKTRSPSVPREMYAPARRTDISPKRASKQRTRTTQCPLEKSAFGVQAPADKKVTNLRGKDRMVDSPAAYENGRLTTPAAHDTYTRSDSAYISTQRTRTTQCPLEKSAFGVQAPLDMRAANLIGEDRMVDSPAAYENGRLSSPAAHNQPTVYMELESGTESEADLETVQPYNNEEETGKPKVFKCTRTQNVAVVTRRPSHINKITTPQISKPKGERKARVRTKGKPKAEKQDDVTSTTDLAQEDDTLQEMKFPNLHGSKSPQTAQPYRRTEQSLPILPYSGYTFNYNQAAKFGYGANPYMAYTPYMGATMPPYMMAMGPGAYSQNGSITMPNSAPVTPRNQSQTQFNPAPQRHTPLNSMPVFEMQKNEHLSNQPANLAHSNYVVRQPTVEVYSDDNLLGGRPVSFEPSRMGSMFVGSQAVRAIERAKTLAADAADSYHEPSPATPVEWYQDPAPANLKPEGLARANKSDEGNIQFVNVHPTNVHKKHQNKTKETMDDEDFAGFYSQNDSNYRVNLAINPRDFSLLPPGSGGSIL